MPFKLDKFNGQGVTVGKIRGSAALYRREIAKMVRLSSFSYFEAYIGEALEEIVAFHRLDALTAALRPPIDESLLSADQKDAAKVDA